MKKFAAFALALAACSKPFHAPPPLKSTPMPSGAALKPYAGPSNARPQGLAQIGGTIFVSLSNQRDDFSIGGPGLVATLIPSTGAVGLIDLGGTDEKQCQNPGFVRADGNKVYLPCSGDFSGTDSGRALVEVDPAGAGSVTRRAAIPSGWVPNGIAVGPAKIWIADSLTTSLISVDRTTFMAADGAGTAPAIKLACDSPQQKFSYLSDAAIISGDLWALCASDVEGILFRLDAQSGAAKGMVKVGPNPTELTATGDGRIAVLNAGDQTLSLVTYAANTLTAQAAFTFSSTTSALQDIRARDNFLYTVASGNNTAQKIDLAAKNGPKLVAEASFANGAGPYQIFPLDDDQAIVTDRGTNDVAAAVWIAVP